MLWDFVLWDFVLWDFVRRDFVLWDFVLWDSVRIPYAVYKDTRFYSDRFRNNSLHAQTMVSAIFFESRITILATIEHNWQCISWLIIDSTKEFHVDRYENISKQDGCI